jgi:hypothetical protein
MIFTIIAVVLFVISLVTVIFALIALVENENDHAVTLGVVSLIALIIGVWFQMHRIIPTQHVGVSRSTFSQKLYGLHQAGLITKPFFGSVYEYPASSSFQRCEKYTPAIKGSYGITIDLCFYYDTGHVDWLAEINKTGNLKDDSIMSVWRNSVVGNVAKSVKEYTPEALSDNRAEVEQTIFENVEPWFTERNIPLVRVSFKNWEFTSPQVAENFDASIVSQRKITEQMALFEAAKISRDREKYEAETAKLVAEWQRVALDELGLEGQTAIDYLWIKMLTEQGKSPDVLILGTSNIPVSIPLKESAVSSEISNK